MDHRQVLSADRGLQRDPVSSAQRAIELGRPLILVSAFLLAVRFVGPWAAPLALVCVFAVAILVHDLLHNALHLPKGWSEVALSFFALFLIKSGHALRESHLRHHQLCLTDADEEGRVAHQSILRLVLTGPWIAVRARVTAFQSGVRTRRRQAIETGLNALSFLALVGAALRGSMAALLYLSAVILITLTAPIWGAKIPHTLPVGHPFVRWLRLHVGRWTPAASSVLFHELHHRAPRLPVSLLALHRAEIEARPASPCEELPPR